MDDGHAELAGGRSAAWETFDRMAMTTPEKAARQILTAVERDRRRALVGPDAKVLDLLARLPGGLYQKALVRGARSGLARSTRRAVDATGDPTPATTPAPTPPAPAP